MLDFKQLTNSENGFFLISGPCVVESEELCLNVASRLKELTTNLGIPYVFKASYRKANRTSDNSFQGIGDDEALKILEKVKNEIDVPILTDIHETKEVNLAADVADVLQIPAFLARQTELLKAAGESGRAVNVKKGQFMSAEAMGFALEKVRNTGNKNVMLTERGSFFGYQDLVVDFRSLIHMQEFNCPVIYDATHSLQRPNQSKGVSGGRPEYIIPMARAAMATGIQGLFVETHPDPANALSDGENMLPISLMEGMLKQLIKVKASIRG